MTYKYVGGVRFLASYDLAKDQDINRFEILLCKVLKESPRSIDVLPSLQFGFDFCPETFTPKQLAHCLRSLAYKISKIEVKNG